MKVHELKIYPQYFRQVVDGNKTFEIRKNDRGFQKGDRVILKEWDNIVYSGREIRATIKYIIDDKFVGLEKGYVAFSLEIDNQKNTENTNKYHHCIECANYTAVKDGVRGGKKGMCKIRIRKEPRNGRQRACKLFKEE